MLHFFKMRVLRVIIILFLASRSCWARSSLDSSWAKYVKNFNREDSCAKIIARFLPKDFPSSSFSPTIIDHEEFSKWAARNANRVYRQFKSATDPLKILEAVGRSRNFLEKKNRKSQLKNGVKDPPLKYFGFLRIDSDDPTAWTSFLTHSRYEPQCPGNSLLGIARCYPFERKESVLLIKKDQVMSRQINYVSTSGSNIFAGVIEQDLYEQKIRVVHPQPPKAKLIFEDGLKRLKGLARIKDIGDRQREFLHSYFAYFQAMPFWRGSAAIGRAFWTAASDYYLNQRISFTDGSDYLALLMNQEDFVFYMQQMHFPNN